MEKILVRACLLGEKCRYDGAARPNQEVINALSKYECIAVCPEVMGGLPTPRKSSEILGNRVVMVDGTDVNAEYEKGAKIALDLALRNGCRLAVLKARSPSCGKGLIYDGTYTKTLKKGNGIAAQLLMDNGIAVIDETEIEKLDL